MQMQTQKQRTLDSIRTLGFQFNPQSHQTKATPAKVIKNDVWSLWRGGFGRAKGRQMLGNVQEQLLGHPQEGGCAT
eukprot:12786335-Alexandrium_andersonii.AAC.1